MVAQKFKCLLYSIQKIKNTKLYNDHFKIDLKNLSDENVPLQKRTTSKSYIFII